MSESYKVLSNRRLHIHVFLQPDGQCLSSKFHKLPQLPLQNLPRLPHGNDLSPVILKAVHFSSLGICKLPEGGYRNEALDDAMLRVNYGFLGITFLLNGLQ